MSLGTKQLYHRDLEEFTVVCRLDLDIDEVAAIAALVRSVDRLLHSRCNLYAIQVNIDEARFRDIYLYAIYLVSVLWLCTAH